MKFGGALMSSFAGRFWPADSAMNSRPRSSKHAIIGCSTSGASATFSITKPGGSWNGDLASTGAGAGGAGAGDAGATNANPAVAKAVASSPIWLNLDPCIIIPWKQRRRPRIALSVCGLPRRRKKLGGLGARRASNPAELPLQIVAAEEQGGGPAVRAVVGVVAEGALGHERGDLLLGERIARAHRRVAGHAAQ